MPKQVGRKHPGANRTSSRSLCLTLCHCWPNSLFYFLMPDTEVPYCHRSLGFMMAIVISPVSDKREWYKRPTHRSSKITHPLDPSIFVSIPTLVFTPLARLYSCRHFRFSSPLTTNRSPTSLLYPYVVWILNVRRILRLR